MRIVPEPGAIPLACAALVAVCGFARRTTPRATA
jgi:hypothetical protein